MSGKDYKHYLLLTQQDLILMIEKKDNEIQSLKQKLEGVKESRDKYCEYNQFHMEEITRLDKIIGGYKKKEKKV